MSASPCFPAVMQSDQPPPTPAPITSALPGVVPSNCEPKKAFLPQIVFGGDFVTAARRVVSPPGFPGHSEDGSEAKATFKA